MSCLIRQETLNSLTLAHPAASLPTRLASSKPIIIVVTTFLYSHGNQGIFLLVQRRENPSN
jgi:hypothetical protein